MCKPWTSKAFTVAAFLMLATLTLGVVGYVIGGEPPGWFFPTMFALFGATVLAGVTGLAGLYEALRHPAPRLARAGLVLAGLAALGAMGWVGIALTGRPPWEIGGAFYGIVVGGGLATFLAGSLVLGIAALRTAVLPRAVGTLLVIGGLTFLIPITATTLVGQPVEWLPFTVLAVWVVVFGGNGALLRRPVATEVGEGLPLGSG